jgi:hypothetical protein
MRPYLEKKKNPSQKEGLVEVWKTGKKKKSSGNSW